MTRDSVNPPPLYEPDHLDHLLSEGRSAGVLTAILMLVIVLFCLVALLAAIAIRFGLLSVAALCGLAVVVLCCAAAMRR